MYTTLSLVPIVEIRMSFAKDIPKKKLNIWWKVATKSDGSIYKSPSTIQLLTLEQRTEFCNADRHPLVTQLSDVIETQFRCLPYVFGYKLFNGTIRNTVGWTRKSEIQDGG